MRFALEQVLQHDVPIVCAGRTDAGVHALDQVVSFDTEKPVDPEALRTSLNSMCKPHIVVSDVEAVADDFDARFSCTAGRIGIAFSTSGYGTHSVWTTHGGYRSRSRSI